MAPARRVNRQRRRDPGVSFGALTTVLIATITAFLLWTPFSTSRPTVIREASTSVRGQPLKLEFLSALDFLRRWWRWPTLLPMRGKSGDSVVTTIALERFGVR